MLPTVALGPLTVNTHLLLNALAVLVMLWGIDQRLRQRRLYFGVYAAIDAAFYIGLGVVAGAWLAFTLPLFARALLGLPVPDRWWALGTHWMGYVAGGVAAGYLYARQRGYPFWEIIDAYAPLLALALAIARIGCFLAGDAHGKETDSYLGMFLPDASGHWAHRYPTQLVSILANLIITVVLLGVERLGARRAAGFSFPGLLFLLYVLLFSLQRFVFDFWRGDATPFFGPFNWTHLYCVLAGGWAFALIVHRLRQRRRAASASSLVMR